MRSLPRDDEPVEVAVEPLDAQAGLGSLDAGALADLMRAYAALVEDTAVRDRFLGTILSEYESTRAIIDDLFQGTFEGRRPRLAYTLNIREEPLKVLHHQQIGLLREWRGLTAAGKTEAADAMVSDLLISINAIASGLRTTG